MVVNNYASGYSGDKKEISYKQVLNFIAKQTFHCIDRFIALL